VAFTRLATPTQDILIRRCRFKEGHGGITVGSEISGGVRNVFTDDCHIDSPNLWYAIRFKNNALRGGHLENFYYRNLTVGQVERAAITCDFNYEEGGKGPFKPVLRNIVIENLQATSALRILDSQGLPNAPVQGIHLRNCCLVAQAPLTLIVRRDSGTHKVLRRMCLESSAAASMIKS
jgi:polygalacturonase